MEQRWASVSEWVSRRPWRVVAGTLVLVVVFVSGMAALKFDTNQNELIGGGTKTARESAVYQSQFGGEAVLVLYTGPVGKLFTAANMAAMTAFEQQLRKTGLFETVIGPLDAMQYAQAQLPVAPQMIADAQRVDPHLAAALQLRLDGEVARLARVDGPQNLANPSFFRYLLYGGNGRIRPALAVNLPDPNHAVLVARLRGNGSIAQMSTAVAAVRRSIAEHPTRGVATLVTGSPLLLTDINNYLRTGIAELGAIAVAVMIIILLLLFRVRWRLLSLVVVAVSAVVTFGVMGLAGIPLNLVTIAGLPILVGMGVDFSIQMHSRFEEEIDAGGHTADAVGRTMGGLAPALAAAMVAAVLSFLVMQLSQVPMLRQFGVMLDIGVASIFFTVVFVPLALLVIRERRTPTVAHQRTYGGAVERAVRWLTRLVQRRVLPMTLVCVAVAAAGFAVEGRFVIQTDPQRWIPQNGSTVRGLDQLASSVGFSSELDLMVQAPDVTATPVVAWMQRFAQEQISRHPKQLTRFTSVTEVVASVTGGVPDRTQVLDALTVAPSDFRRTFVSSDHTRANIVFEVANVSLAEQAKVLADMKADLHPPSGVTVTPTGLAVTGIALVDALQADRDLITLIALGLVALWLVVFTRRVILTVITLFPVVVAVGLSSLALYATGLQLSPLTAVMGPLVIAVGTEFAILIVSRYLEERARGRSPDDALDTGIVRIGRALTASGLTVVAGFAVMTLSSFPLLRDFGIVVAINTLVALLSALVVLPPLLVRIDRSSLFGPLARDDRADRGRSRRSDRRVIAANPSVDPHRMNKA